MGYRHETTCLTGTVAFLTSDIRVNITHYLGNTSKLAYLDVAKLGNKLYSSRRKVVLDIGIGEAMPDTNV